MKIATLLFTYNRSYHTKQVLDSLRANTVLPQKLYIFQDGLKEEEETSEWKKVNDLIHSVAWCDTEIIVSEKNKGLADSIVSGIDYACRENDAVIVVEDDCVTAPGFIQFMVQCFERYQDEKRVYSVSGYSWPIDLASTDSDIYFCGRSSSWGWGTWKDRWQSYSIDYTLYRRLKATREGSLAIALWGRSVEDTLIGIVTGRINSWGHFWGLRIMIENGVCINPYKSLIQNIGFDGTGVNCDISDRFDVDLDKGIKEYRFPERIEIFDSVKKSFAGLYGSYTAVNDCHEGKERIVVYGLGRMFMQNEKDINERYYIEAFIDNGKAGYYAGKDVLKAKDIGKIEQYDKILIMIQDINECMKVCKELVCKYKVEAEKIELGCQNYGTYYGHIKEIRVRADGTWDICFGEGCC